MTTIIQEIVANILGLHLPLVIVGSKSKSGKSIKWKGENSFSHNEHENFERMATTDATVDIERRRGYDNKQGKKDPSLSIKVVYSLYQATILCGI